MPHVCALITIAMQLTCAVDKEILCTDNDYLAQLLNVPSCERVFSDQGRADVAPAQQRVLDFQPLQRQLRENRRPRPR
jgi:hypothetical protein